MRLLGSGAARRESPGWVLWLLAAAGLILIVAGYWVAATDGRATGYHPGMLITIPGWGLLAGAAAGALTRRRGANNRSVTQAEADAGTRPGTTTADGTRLADLEKEVRELRRANGILRSASAFFAAELDRPSP